MTEHTRHDAIRRARLKVLKQIRSFIVERGVRFAFLLGFFNLFLWIINVQIAKAEWWILLIYMVGGSLFLLVIWSFLWSLDEEARNRRKVNKTKTSDA